MRIRLATLLFMAAGSLAAYPTKWFEGVVVLAGGQVLTARISLPSFELVVARTNQGTLVLKPGQLDQVRFFDPQLNINRRLVTVLSPQPTLFEVVVGGEVQVLRRPRTFILPPTSSDRDDYIYYFRAGDEVELLTRFGSMYPLLVDRLTPGSQRALNKLGLHPSEPPDAIQIIQFLNHALVAREVLASF